MQNNESRTAEVKELRYPTFSVRYSAVQKPFYQRMRHAFMGYTAAVMLAVLMAAADGITQDIAQASRGIQSDIVPGPSREAQQAAKIKAESYLKIAPSDENAPRGKLEINIRPNTLNYRGVIKIHFTKIETSDSSESSRTEGLGYALGGHFLQEGIPVGEYLLEYGFAGKALMRGPKITIKENEAIKLNIEIHIHW
jgi:hypothetical protein